tara:strand:- start:47 stop:301 length:255 start_codon:yes stop_codon:yes gene_type:complete
MAKKTKSKKKAPQTFKKVSVVCTSSSRSLKDAKSSVKKDLLSYGIKGKEQLSCMEDGVTTFKESTQVHTFSASGIISVADNPPK